jgi:acetate kinase
VACFDTAFHRDLPRVAALLPVPRRYEALGVRRYGFHGLSYTWLMQALEQRAGHATAHGRVILAHLGGGASLAAVREGRCLDTTMGFSPCGGLPMATRSGDLDPGLLVWLMRSQGLDADALSEVVNGQSGLRGMSETSGDVRVLLEAEARGDVRAAEALAVFCDRVRQGIGAFATVLGGLDTLVFAGGIGEHAAVIRARCCAGLSFLGIEIDAARNERREDVVSRDGSRVRVHVIPTDEEQVIARAAITLFGLDTSSNPPSDAMRSPA